MPLHIIGRVSPYAQRHRPSATVKRTMYVDYEPIVARAAPVPVKAKPTRPAKRVRFAAINGSFKTATMEYPSYATKQWPTRKDRWRTSVDYDTDEDEYSDLFPEYLYWDPVPSEDALHDAYERESEDVGGEYPRYSRFRTWRGCKGPSSCRKRFRVKCNRDR